MLKFKARCHYEIGDRVRFEKTGNSCCKGKIREMEITDIITQISAKTGHIKFILELGGWYKLDTDLQTVDVRRI